MRLLAGWLLALATTAAVGQTDADLSFRADGWSGDRLLDDRGALAAASVWGRAKLDLGDAGQVVGQGWVRRRTRSDGAPGGRVRELSWRDDVGPVSLRIGRQMLVWGRADGLNPTDNLSPRDFTLLVPDDGDQRSGRDALTATLHAGAGDFLLAGFPNGVSHTIPLAQVAGLRYRIERPPRRAQWALKWDAQGDGVDGSVSYFDGTDPWPDLALASVSAAGIEVALRNQAARVLGADLSVARGSVVWRAEAAYLRTASAGAADFAHKKDQLWIVGGGEWQVRSDTTLGLELTAKQVFDFAPVETIADPIEREIARRQVAIAGQTARRQAGVVWRVAKRFDDARWNIEASGVALGPRGNGAARLLLDWSLSDTVSLRAGAVATFGPDDSTFGQLNRNRLVFVQMRLGWSAR